MTDRQAADAVRSRIDWKYALSLELTDPGFDFSVLCEFRVRLISGSAEQKLLDILLKQFKEKGIIKDRGKQRTDSTHVLANLPKVRLQHQITGSIHFWKKHNSGTPKNLLYGSSKKVYTPKVDAPKSPLLPSMLFGWFLG